MAALRWIQGVKQWPPFIENRVSIVRQLNLTKNFYYICSEQNPADLLTRGLTFDKLESSNLWWHGPSYNFIDLSDLESNSSHVFVNTVSCSPSVDISRYSSLTMLINIMFYILKFVHSARRLTYAFDYDQILLFLIKLEQNCYFSEEISILKKGKTIRDYKGLNLVLNDDMICVQTRYLNHDILPRFLILLSNKSCLTNLIICQEHCNNLHSSAKHTLSNLRLKYWIIQGKKTVQHALRSCHKCSKIDSKPYSSPDFAPLPSFRSEKTLPFVNIGIDFAGPFLVKANLTSRSQANLKAYICLFVCAGSRAIHLEITLDLLTESFIEALRRFIAVRGVPNLIYSDNGKTFEGASKLVSKTLNGKPNDSVPKEEFANMAIQWNFIPPRSPWWGGFYERMVQVVKNL